MSEKVRPVALVTGGAKRLGRSIALTLAQDGWDVALHYGRSAAAAEQTLEELRKLGAQAIALSADLDIESEIEELLPRCARELGEVQCLVNNAARFEFDTIEQFESERLRAQMQTNLVAPLLLARNLHRRQLAQRAPPASAVVINILDQKLFNPNPDYFSYTLSKAALHAATTLMAQALAPLVRCVGVAPGITLPSDDQTEEGFEQAHRVTPLGRSSTPDEVAQAVCYAARARALTGTTLLVDGGQHLWPTERDIMFLAR
jgi:NAD(P)-dependent dehydrogenase (short-subunit alcohol dehydrogenase family)